MTMERSQSMAGLSMLNIKSIFARTGSRRKLSLSSQARCPDVRSFCERPVGGVFWLGSEHTELSLFVRRAAQQPKSSLQFASAPQRILITHLDSSPRNMPGVTVSRKEK